LAAAMTEPDSSRLRDDRKINIPSAPAGRSEKRCRPKCGKRAKGKIAKRLKRPCADGQISKTCPAPFAKIF
jgi:hypothetical protein